MTATTQAPVLDRRIDLLYFFDVTDGNPNGDPDAGNLPRVDPETLHGLVSDGCIKRKIRDFATIAMTGADGNPAAGYEIYFQHRGVLNNQHQRALDAVKPTLPEGTGKAETTEVARRWMCANFFDVRTFGAVMTTGVNCGQVRGPAQFTFARSLQPVLQHEHAITRKSVTTQKEADAQVEKHDMVTGTMGRKYTVPYGLYRAQGFLSAHLARDTGFTRDDLDLLIRAMLEMWDHDRSASRGLMATRLLYAFEHSTLLGEAPAHRLFQLIDLKPKDGVETPRAFTDYQVTVDADALPAGVKLTEHVENQSWGALADNG